MLSNLPKGSFLIRPHDTNNELYFLSFNSGDDGVKHAIIRQEIDTVHTIVPTNIDTLFDKDCDTNNEKINKKINEKIYDRAENMTYVSAQNIDTEQTVTNVINVSNKTMSKIVYKCGKVGPCDTIEELLR